MSVSILILTLNEASNIESCLESVKWCDDVVVLDSFSTDDTVSLARARGARVVQRVFDDYATQRNFGLQEIDYRHPWILMLDADERVTPALRSEIETLVSTAPEDLALVNMRRKDYLFGRWLRRSSGYPTWFGRLARRGRVWVERPINERYCTEGTQGFLSEHLDHYPYNQGFSHWMRKHDRYSTMEAQALHEHGHAPVSIVALTRGDAPSRRAALKSTVYRLPARPLWMFLALYLLRGGVWEGRAGLTACALRAFYEFMIDCKRTELARRSRGVPI